MTPDPPFRTERQPEVGILSRRRKRGRAMNDDRSLIDKDKERETEKANENDRDRLSTTSQSKPRPTALIIILLLALGLNLLIRGKSSRLPNAYAICSREGRIYTVERRYPQVECIAVLGSRILSVGSIDEIRSRFGDVDKTGPLLSRKLGITAARDGMKFYFVKPGHAIVPGMADSHAHVLEQGYKTNLEVGNTSSVLEVIEKVKSYVKARPDILQNKTVWIEGMGWDQTKWPGGEFPTAADFDQEPLLRDRPILLRRVDGHAIWVSQRVIEETGKLPNSIEGGSIIRDEHGSPTGVFVDNAMALVKPPEWSEKQMLQYYHSAIREALSYGLTSIHDAWSTPEAISFYKKIADANKLPIRLYLMAHIESDKYWGDSIEKFVNYGPAGRLTLRSIKLMSDGALGSWGAALLEPYSDKPEIQGTLLSSPKDLQYMISRFWDDGFQVNVHCIGDRANHVVLDIFEDQLRNTSAEERRPRIEHAQIMTKEDLERTASLGVITSVQPTHATSDMWYAEARLGPERIKHAYAYKTLLESSKRGVLPLGSDFPVEGVNPLLGFYAAVTRLSVNGESPHGEKGWYANEKLTRAQALKGMTLDAAYASFSEDDIGSLAPGKRADYVVLDVDIMDEGGDRAVGGKGRGSEILDAKVVVTVVDGRPMYGHMP